MSHQSTPPPIAEPARSYRCSVCASEQEPYTGETPTGKCVVFEAFHAHRGAQKFCMCHDCSTRLVAAWAKTRGEKIASTKAAPDHEVPITQCEECGALIAGGRLCTRCHAAQ